jgi:putative aldouronate transport system permease protein
MLPMIFFFICWRYIPMTGLLIAFKNFDGIDVLKSDWYGLAGIQTIMFGDSSAEFWRSFRNTFTLSFYGLVFGFPFPIILALLFSEIKNQVYRSVVQIFSYLPKFISTVVITTLVTLLCKYAAVDSTGTVTAAGGPITSLLTVMGLIKPDFKIMYTASMFRPVYVISGLWEGAGYGSIVYFAAILSISPTSYEAARMDGASKMAQIRHVTIPGISSTLIIMLILDIGKLLTVGYEKVLLLYNSSTYETADVISTFVYRIGVSNTNGSPILKTIAASADLFNSIIAMLLVIGSNIISRKVSDTSLY